MTDSTENSGGLFKKIFLDQWKDYFKDGLKNYAADSFSMQTLIVFHIGLFFAAYGSGILVGNVKFELQLCCNMAVLFLTF